jgi:hypothetical protein
MMLGVEDTWAVPARSPSMPPRSVARAVSRAVRVAQPCLRIGAEDEKLPVPLEPVFPAPEAADRGVDEEIEPAAVGELVGLATAWRPRIVSALTT